MAFVTDPVGRADVDQWVNALMGDSLTQLLGGRARAESLLRTRAYVPSFQPAVRRAVGGPNGLLFLERVAAGSLHHWEVWKKGRRVGVFHLAPSMELQEASDSSFMAVDRSRSGVDTLIVAVLQSRVGGA